MSKYITRFACLVAITSSLAAVIASAPAAAEGVASPWVEGFNNKARLLAGTASDTGKTKAIFGAIEIAMPPGWKTYWRAPGDAGGIPPEFDFSGSENVGELRVLYPAPHRLIDKTGTTVGYKDQVMFPVAVIAKDVAKPVHLKLKAAYGVCKELCVPAEAELDLVIPTDVGASSDIADVLPLVPRPTPIQGTDPIVSDWRVEMRAEKPILIITADDPSATTSDAFVDAAAGVYLPVPKKISDAKGRTIFEVNLTEGADLKDLAGKPLRITLVGGKGQSETTIVLP